MTCYDMKHLNDIKYNLKWFECYTVIKITAT